MRVMPDPAAFAQAYEAGKAQVVWTTLVADLETPVSAFLKLADSRPYACLFESVEGGATIGRYSFIGLKPDLRPSCKQDVVGVQFGQSRSYCYRLSVGC